MYGTVVVILSIILKIPIIKNVKYSGLEILKLFDLVGVY